MKTKEAIKALASKLYPESEDIIDDIRNGKIRFGFIEGYAKCQQDNKPVDVEKLREEFDKKYDISNLEERAAGRLVDQIFDFFKPFLTNTSEDKESWVSVDERVPDRMQDCLFGNVNIGRDMVVPGWYDNGFYSYLTKNKLPATHWRPLPQPPKQTA